MINVSINDFKHPCYVVRDEITIAAVESFGFKYVPNNANLNEKENKKAFFLENNYQVYHWSRHKKDFYLKHINVLVFLNGLMMVGMLNIIIDIIQI